MIDDSVNSLLSGGAPSAKFPTIGTTVKGTIRSAVTGEQRDINGATRTWDDGKPRMQIVITLATDERDPEIADDDGERRLFVKGGMLQALRSALKAAGATTLEVGARLAVQYSGDGKQDKPGFSPPKEFVAQYASPAPGVGAGVSDLL